MNTVNDESTPPLPSTQRSLEEMNAIKLALEIRKLRLESLLQFSAVIFLVSVSIGAIIIFHYFFHLDFNAGGISAADTISMALTSFGFLAMTVLLLMTMTVAAYPISREGGKLLGWCIRSYRKFHTAQKKPWEGFSADDIGTPYRLEWRGSHYVERVMGFVLLAWMIYLMYDGPIGVMKVLFPLLGAGTFLTFFVFGKKIHVYCPLRTGQPDRGVDKWLNSLSRTKRDSVIVAVVTLVLVGFSADGVEGLSLSAVGFRKHDVSVRLAKEDFHQLVSLASRSGIAINPCEAVDPNAYVVHGVDVLWHRLGTNALLRIPAQDIGAAQEFRSSIRLEPANSSLNILESRHPNSKCAEFFVDTLFTKDSAKFRYVGTQILLRDTAWLKAHPESKVSVVVYESTAQRSETLTVDTLALARAKAIRRYLMETYGMKMEDISVLDAGSRDLKYTCSEKDDFRGKWCENANRRIEIHQSDYIDS
jgi:outer membrane protein OmpA-like peptidoglycan-associated protein